MTAKTRAASQREASTGPADPSDELKLATPSGSPPSSPLEEEPGTASTRPVRQQLKKTHLKEDEDESDEQSVHEADSSDSASVQHDEEDPGETLGTEHRGRLQRKRSFDEIDFDSPDASIRQPRKRSKSGAGGSAKGGEILPQAEVEKPAEAGLPDVEPTVLEDVKDDTVATETATLSATDPEAAAATTRPQDDKPSVDQGPVEAESGKAELVGGSANREFTPPIVDATSVSLLKEISPEEPTKLPPPNEQIPPTSPKNKRNRNQFSGDDDDDNEQPKKLTEKLTSDTREELKLEPLDAGDESKVKREDHTEGELAAKIPSTSGFANTSVASPFGARASKSPPPPPPAQTSAKAFASSGFASFATSASPFGSAFGAAPKASEAAKESTDSTKTAPAVSSFASLTNASSPFASTKPSTFGSTIGFGGSTSGFGSLSNGFGSAFKAGTSAPLTSFASTSTTGIIGTSNKPIKPIGAADNEEDAEEGEASEAEDNAIKPVEDNAPKDPRFFEQEVETGEEGEETVFSQRAKLYVITDKVWKERGVGVFKMNVAYDLDESGDPEEVRALKKSARFIMRADGSHRIVLNSPLTKDITITDPTGGKPKGKHAVFLGFLDGQPKLMQLKMKSNIQTGELHSAVAAYLAGE